MRQVPEQVFLPPMTPAAFNTLVLAGLLAVAQVAASGPQSERGAQEGDALDELHELRSAATSLATRIDALAVAPADPDLLRELVDEHGRLVVWTNALRRRWESMAGEDELRLEHLYRSDRWFQLGRVLMSLRYWSGWLHLQTRRGASADAGGVSLAAAEQAFRAVLPVVVYPDLVRGSWLGLGYCALARGDERAARHWWGALVDSTAGDEDVLVRRAKAELALLRAATPPAVPTRNLDADGLMANVIGLLQRHRRTGDGALAAARGIRSLEAHGALTPTRVEQLFAFQQELLGQEIGPLGHLLAADDALRHEQFVTALDKYRRFFAALGPQRERLFAAHLERFAAAAVATGLWADALELLERAPPTPEVHRLTAYAAMVRYGAQGTERKRLVSATKQCVVPFCAWLAVLVAPATLDARQTAEILRSSQPGAGLLFAVALREAFADLDPATGARRRTNARMVYDRLPRGLQEVPWVALADLRLRFLAGEAARPLLEQLAAWREATREHPGLVANLAGDAALLELRLTARLTLDELLNRIRTALLSREDLERRAVAELFTNCVAQSWCEPAVQVAVNTLGLQDPLGRRLVRKLIELQMSSGDPLSAFRHSEALVAADPSSGDGWQLLATAALAVQRPDRAAVALDRLSAALPRGSEHWLAVQRQRRALAAAWNAPSDPCDRDPASAVQCSNP